MAKYFLLTAGDQYYPSSGDGDWIDFFETYEEAESQITRDHKIIPVDYGDDINSVKYIINGRYYDWYYIIDLKSWSYD
jgi:hypothetical protein